MSVKAYDPAVYHKLGDIDAQAKIVTQQEINGLGKIILKYVFL